MRVTGVRYRVCFVFLAFLCGVQTLALQSQVGIRNSTAVGVYMRYDYSCGGAFSPWSGYTWVPAGTSNYWQYPGCGSGYPNNRASVSTGGTDGTLIGYTPEYQGAGPHFLTWSGVAPVYAGTNAVVCITWTNKTDKGTAPAWQLLSVTGIIGGEPYVPESYTDLRAVSPGAIVSFCITNNAYGVNDTPLCGAGVVVEDARAANFGTVYAERAVYAWQCYGVLATNDIENGLTAMTNIGYVDIFGPAATNNPTILSTNAATGADINQLGNALLQGLGDISKEVADLNKALTGEYGPGGGGDGTNGTYYGTGEGEYTKGIYTNTLYLKAAAEVTYNWSTNFTGVYDEWLESKGLDGTNFSGQLGYADGWVGGSVAGVVGGVADGMGSGSGSRQGGIAVMGTSAEASWGVINLGWLGAQLDLKKILSLSFLDNGVISGAMNWPVYFPGFRGLMRSFLLWCAIVLMWKTLSEDVYASIMDICKVPQLPNYNVQVLGTTVLGASEAARLLKWVALMAALALVPVVTVAAVETGLTLMGMGGAGGVTGLPSVVASGGVKTYVDGDSDISRIFWLINQGLPLIELFILLVNGALAGFALNLVTVKMAILGKII